MSILYFDGFVEGVLTGAFAGTNQRGLRLSRLTWSMGWASSVSMSCMVTIRDETASGNSLNSFTLEFFTERVTVREIIRARVYQEVQDFNQAAPETFRGLVAPTEAEQTLNGCKMKSPRKIDWQKQFDRAIEGFNANAFFVLIDDRQADDLDEMHTVSVDTEISFVKLVPLVGG